ncbi:MAG: FeoB-associated Cys-rich membrane protein [Gemmatimonadaceae bacterium]
MEQTLIVAAIVLAAGAYLGRRTWRKLAAQKQAKAGGPACRDCCR